MSKRNSWFKVPHGKPAKYQRYIHALLYAFNIHTLLLMSLACLAVYVCDRLGFKYNMDFTLVATGTTFPLVFTIQQAFSRRERATLVLSSLKASVVCLYWMHRDWDLDRAPQQRTSADNCRALLFEFLSSLRSYLTAHRDHESHAELRLAAKRNPAVKIVLNDVTLADTASQASFQSLLHEYEHQDPAYPHLKKCFRCLSRLSVLNEQLTIKAGYSKGGEGGGSRLNQYLRYIVNSLEDLRTIRNYRTPAMMRHASAVLVHVFAILLAPYFTHFCDSWISGGGAARSCPAGYSASIVYVVIVMLLFHVGKDVEEPLDMMGLDDLFFELDSELEELVDDEQCDEEMLSGARKLAKMRGLPAVPPTMRTVSSCNLTIKEDSVTAQSPREVELFHTHAF